jgi:hypothetical protein
MNAYHELAIRVRDVRVVEGLPGILLAGCGVCGRLMIEWEVRLKGNVSQQRRRQQLLLLLNTLTMPAGEAARVVRDGDKIVDGFLCAITVVMSHEIVQDEALYREIDAVLALGGDDLPSPVCLVGETFQLQDERLGETVKLVRHLGLALEAALGARPIGYDL